MGQVSKYFLVRRFFPRQIYLPHPLTATRSLRVLIPFRTAAIS